MSLVVGSVSLLISLNSDEKLGTMMSNAYFLAVPSTLVAVSIMTARKHGIATQHTSVMWLFVGFAILSVVAETIWIVYESFLQKDPFPSEADLVWLASYPFLFAFLLAYLKPIRKSIPHGIKIFSAIICGGVLVPILTISYSVQANTEPSDLLLNLSYLIADTSILFVAMTATVTLYRRKNKEFINSILFAMVFFLISDVLFLLEVESYVGGNVIDVGWFCGYVLLVFGVLRFRQIVKKDAYTNHVYVEDNQVVNSVDFEPTTKLLIPISVITIITVVVVLLAFNVYNSGTNSALLDFNYYVISGSLASFSLIALFVNKNMIGLVKKRTRELELERDALQIQIKENERLFIEKTKYAESYKSLSREITATLERVANSESRYRTLYESSVEMYRTVNKDGIILDCNTSYAKHLGYSKSEVIGKSVFDHVDEKYIPELKSVFEEWKKNGIIENHELWLKRKDGTTFPVLLSANNLYDNIGNLIGSNTVIKDISEICEARKKIEESEKKVKATLEKMLRLTTAKDEFVAMITHELKTPLVPIISYTELLLSERLGNLTTEQKKRLNIVRTSSHLLQKMISDLLDVQKIEMGHLKLDKRLYNIGEIIKNMIVKMEPIAITKGIQLTADCTEKITCFCDQARIEQVLANLISNAIDFCPKESGRIQIRAYISGDSVKIIVRDNGIGIVKDKLSKIFVKFYQIDSGTTREHSGTGLGLAVCKGIVEMHGGKIWAESNGPGTGTQIHIILPLTQHEPMVDF
jgi:PAS domain S-box-containing protein